MATNSTLKDVFIDFASFGNRTSRGGLDGRGFVKLIKDCKLLDKAFTTTDADLIFSNTKVKPKSERRITYDEFLIALQLVAERKKRPLDQVIDQVTAHRPQAQATTAKADGGIFAKLTDTSKYTGAHKSRFDKDGNGTGGGGGSGQRERSLSGSRPARERSGSRGVRKASTEV